MVLLCDRYASQLRGVLSCFDRIIVSGTMTGLNYAEGMAAYLHTHHIRLFDYPRFAEPLRDEVRANAERVASENGIEIDFIRSKNAFRKEDRIHEVLTKRGDHPGLVHIFSAMEACPSYEPWHDKSTGTIRAQARRFCVTKTPNASTITSTSFTSSSASAIYVSLRGLLFACSFTATATTGWPISSGKKV